MQDELRHVIVGLGATAFFAFLPSALPITKKIAIPGAILSFFLTIGVAWKDIILLLNKIRGTGNEDIPLWYPYLLGLILAFLIIGFGGLIIRAIKAHYTRLELHVKSLEFAPDKYWFSCNILGYDYLTTIGQLNAV